MSTMMAAQLEKHLASCAAMAGAGVASLVLVAPASGDIISSGTLSLTPGAEETIALDFSSTPTATVLSGPYLGALDGTSYEFGVWYASYFTDSYLLANTTYAGGELYFAGAFTATVPDSYAIAAGTLIDGSTTWQAASPNGYGYGGGINFLSASPGWTGPTSAYVGVKIYKASAGASYYGWIGVTMTGVTPTVTGFAWESTPGTGITAGAVPEPGGLGLGALALGSAGLAAWRRRRTAARA